MEYVRARSTWTCTRPPSAWRGTPTRCTHCGDCLAHCPTDALRIADPATRAVAFEPGACVECLACLKICPFGACTSLF